MVPALGGALRRQTRRDYGTHTVGAGVRCSPLAGTGAGDGADGDEKCRRHEHTARTVDMKPVYLADVGAFLRYIEIPGEDPPIALVARLAMLLDR